MFFPNIVERVGYYANHKTENVLVRVVTYFLG